MSNEKTLELVRSILTQAIEISHNSIIDVFVDYASHVDSITVRVYLKGWSENLEKDFYRYVYLTDKDSLEQLNYIDKYLLEIRKE